MRQATQRKEILTGFGNLPDLTPVHQVDFKSGNMTGIPRFGFQTI
jgi:hypothetical protein